ncbi:TonB-dependent receptor [Fulvivirgaceae bacterium BMA12]|uniref:TonB-dependent receptor n=1 Tax=Agaribacillus aureus TaxID=3051825 RepID=A0ABT8L9X5_9BACT|nr:TonB-dependent receptor [Fulvivirgaceae bacterium BMA12]
MKRTLLFTAFILLFQTTFAQSGKIVVSIFDVESGEPLIGATAQVAGTSIGAVADLDGKATLIIDEGTYDLEVSFVSYEKKLITGVEVIAEESTVLNVSLGSDVVGLEEVVVTAEAIKSSENALLTIQKKSATLFDAISADQFSRNGDSDVGAAIKRVTGVTVEGGKYVYVRGLGDRYSKTVLNGADIPGLDPNKNSVQLDVFPSNLISNLIVYKTFSPELPGSFTGGYVNIETKDFPDNFTFKASASVGFNTQSSLRNDFLTYEGGENEAFAFGSKGREIPSIIDGVGARDFPQFGEELNEFSDAFAGRQFERRVKNSLLDHKFSFSLGNQTSLFNKTFGYIASVTYSRSYDAYDNGATARYERPTTGVRELQETRDLVDMRGDENVLWGAMISGSLKLNDLNKIKLNLLHNQSGTNTGRYQAGFWNNSGQRPFIETRTLQYIERGFSNAQLSGEHNIEALNNLEIKWISSYTMSSQEDPDVAFFTNEFARDESGNPEDYRISLSYRRPSRYFRELEEDNWDNKLDFTLPINLWNDLKGKIKFGGAYTKKDREFSEDRYEFTFRVPYDGSGDDYFSTENLGNGVDVQFATAPENSYTANQEIFAGYLGIETWLTKKLRLNGGARFESTKQEIEAENGSQGELDLNDLLPSVNLTYELVESMNLRLSYNKTLARPTFREFAPLSTFDFAGGGIQSGNPALERTLIDNFDFRWEYYPRSGEYLAISPFYKRFENPIENTILNTSDLQFQWQNRDEATLVGLELEARKQLDFLGSAFEKFKLNMNVTLVDSKVKLAASELDQIRQFVPDFSSERELFGQSPFVINAGLQYLDDDKGTDVSLNFNVFGERLFLISTETGALVYEKSRPDLGLNIRQRLSEKWRITLRAQNLINPDTNFELDFFDQDFVWQRYTTGRSFSLGLSYTIEKY